MKFLALLLLSVTMVSAPILQVNAAAEPITKETAKPELKPYTLDTCIVSGEKLGEMGDEQHLVYQEQELKFCCAPCIEKFQKNPAKYLAKIH